MLVQRVLSILILMTAVMAEGDFGFVASRGKKSLQWGGGENQNAFNQNGMTINSDQSPQHGPLEKKQSVGFVGTKGKKSLVVDNSLKRNIGFTGMRGKKYDPFSNSDSIDLDDYWLIRNELAKRKFYGMRGKKFPFMYSAYGVRGKKGPSSAAFFGTRGKKDNVFNKDVLTNNDDNLMYPLTAEKDSINHSNEGDFLEYEHPENDSQFQDQQSGTDEVYSIS